MVDASSLYVDAFHPVVPLMKRDYSGYARCRTLGLEANDPQNISSSILVCHAAMTIPTQNPWKSRYGEATSMPQSFKTPTRLVILSQPTYSTSVMPSKMILL
ncbi:hypothetical protein BDN67DRAFT_974167, partial [Paxillus ammoniavirescens]